MEFLFLLYFCIESYIILILMFVTCFAALILWRVPAKTQDAEGLRLLELISQAKRTGIHKESSEDLV